MLSVKILIFAFEFLSNLALLTRLTESVDNRISVAFLKIAEKWLLMFLFDLIKPAISSGSGGTRSYAAYPVCAADKNGLEAINLFNSLTTELFLRSSNDSNCISVSS